MPNDAQLLREYTERGSESAFRVLVEKHSGLVYQAALRQSGRNAAFAQDVTQAVFVLLARKARTLGRHPSLAGWLYTTTHFTVARGLRNEGRRKVREAEAQNLAEVEAARPDWVQLWPVLDQSMLGLSQSDREAVLLRYFEGRSITEIATTLRLTEAASYKRLERAVERLRRRLRERGIISSAGAVAAILGTETASGTPAEVAVRIMGAAMSAGASPAGEFVFFQLMNTTKIAAAVAALALAASVYLGIQDRARSREVASLHSQIAAIKTDDEGRLRSPMTGTKKAQRSAESPSSFDRGGTAAALRNAAIMVADGPIDPAILAGYRQRFARFVRQHGLSPAQEEKLFKIIGGWDQSSRDYQALVRQQGMFGTVEERKTFDELQQQLEVEPLKDLLGAQGEQAFFGYERLSSLQPFIDPFAKELSEADLSLTDDQMTLMLALVGANIHPIKFDATTRGPNVAIDWDSMLPPAKSFLGPAQSAWLEAYIARNRGAQK